MLRPTLALLLLAACNASPSAPAPAPSSSPPPPEAPAPAPLPAAAPRAAHVNVAFDVPPSWEPLQGTDAEHGAVYRVRPAIGDSEPAIVVARADGSVDSIVARWVAWARPAQPEAARRAERETAGFTVITFELHGAAALLGAIVLSPARAGQEQQLAAEQKRLAELRVKLTEQHPDVKSAIVRVEALLARLARGDEEGEGPMTLELRGPEKTVVASREAWGRVVESFRLR